MVEWLVKAYDEGGHNGNRECCLGRESTFQGRVGPPRVSEQSRAGHSLLPLDESIGRSGPRLEVPAGVVPVVHMMAGSGCCLILIWAMLMMSSDDI